ncbi:MAG: modification methylase [Ruminococcus sp.]|nr:modification methylase [Ruminococcus sp.]
MSSNSNLNAAKRSKNDEFYTTLADVEKELSNYEPLLFDKTILCNCNDGEDSAFWLYFSANFMRLGLKRLIAVKYGADSCGYVLEMECVNGVLISKKFMLQGNGDFRSQESIELLKQADIVITNPPFTLFREYISLLTAYSKKYLIIGNMNDIKFAEVFPLIQNNRLWFGHNAVKTFIQPDRSIFKFGNILWFTNLKRINNNPDIPLTKRYTPENYPRYDNYDAINVDKVLNIPVDYYGVMGVPITFLLKYNPDQFDIIGLTGECKKGDYLIKPKKRYSNIRIHKENGTVAKSNKLNLATVIRLDDVPEGGAYYTVANEKGFFICVYTRVLIKRKG